ncbi:MAG: beta-eliminating lyase-related protein, partial [Verrucomicrobiota bacterium]|nr:beta-eliminating lyase-related protein [Verrucomicrobiota bacterium]
ANSLSLAQLCQPFHAVVCHENAHIQTDECAAPEFFSGGAKLLGLAGAQGKLHAEAIGAALAKRNDVHSSKPRVISVTQSTELGTVYLPNELNEIAEVARAHELFLQMDGARFANAVATLECAPKEITWQLGVDVLSFGGTKNGLGAGELVVFFNKELAGEFDYRVKQGAQLPSKMRFLAAPWSALLRDDVWLGNARRANASAQALARKLHEAAWLEPVFPVQANALFVRLPDALVDELHARGWHFYKFVEPDIHRLMCSWATQEEAIAEFVAEMKALTSAAP